MGFRPFLSTSFLTASALAVASIAAFVVTLERSPVAWPDSIIYASIARALQLDHTGVPTVLRDSPAAVDHLPFYGPVFFQLVTWQFSLFGLSDASIRSVSLGGALLIAIGGVALVRVLGGSLERQAWVGALLLLSPELGRGATDGRMDTLAVGLEVLALAAFARGCRRRSPWLHGMAAGVLLAAAALTTPRSYPFAVAFFGGAVALVWIACDQRDTTVRQITACGMTVLLLVGAWTIAAHGSPGRWLTYMALIATHENIDVAVHAASRDWSFTPWAIITPLAIGSAAILASSRRRADGVRPIELFGWLVAGLNLLICLALFNFTFFFGVYLFIPMLAVALASTPRTKAAATLMALLLAADAAVRTGRYVRLAAVWAATDPRQVERFVKTNVPAGSVVVGEESFYFFAVERTGSRYLFTTRSSADWTRWIPASDRPRHADGDEAAKPTAGRFLLWPADEAVYPLPPSVRCARGEAVAVLDPLPPGRRRMFPIAVTPRLPIAYPKTVLYRLRPNHPGTMTRCLASN